MFRSTIRMTGGVLTCLFSLTFSLAISTHSAEAIPAWARKYEISCSDCHTAWPKLNDYGRAFKINGYMVPGEKEAAAEMNKAISDFLVLDETFPIAARFIMRPYDKTKDNPSKIRAFHEAELMVAGRVYKDISAWLELEAEDEDDFNVFVEQGMMGFHPREEANVVLGWAPPFWADPFDTLADGGRRMTRAHKGPLDLRFSARERLRSASQHVGFYGRAAGKVFYLGGVSSGGDDPEGGDAKDGFGRANIEALRGLYVGGFILAGTNQTQDVDLDFSRAGLDFQFERGGLNVYGLVLRANDDLLDGGDQSWTVAYVEGFYTFQLKKIPMIVPLMRIDFLDDFADRTDLTFNLNFYLTYNLKAYVEWWQNIDSPAGTDKDHRITIQVDFAL
jgi:hypothetical protein